MMDVAKIGDLVLSWSTGWSKFVVKRITEVEERKDAWGYDIVMYRGEQVYEFFETPDLESLSRIDGDFWGCAHLVYAMSDEDYARLVAADQLAIEKQRAKEMEERPATFSVSSRASMSRRKSPKPSAMQGKPFAGTTTCTMREATDTCRASFLARRETLPKSS